jgi:Holliday junction resolvase RusA-like endonuclease
VIGKFASAYMPKDYKDWKAEVAKHLTGFSVGDKAVEIKIACYLKKPKTSKLPFPRSDVDNFAKSVMDAATEAGVWDDDRQVQSLHVHKDWHNCLDPFEGGEGIVLIVKEL